MEGILLFRSCINHFLSPAWSAVATSTSLEGPSATAVESQEVAKYPLPSPPPLPLHPSLGIFNACSLPPSLSLQVTLRHTMVVGEEEGSGAEVEVVEEVIVEGAAATVVGGGVEVTAAAMVAAEGAVTEEEAGGATVEGGGEEVGEATVMEGVAAMEVEGVVMEEEEEVEEEVEEDMGVEGRATVKEAEEVLIAPGLCCYP